MKNATSVPLWLPCIWNCCILIQILLEFIPRRSIYDEPVLLQIMARRLTSNISISDSIMANAGDAYMRHAALMSWKEVFLLPNTYHKCKNIMDFPLPQAWEYTVVLLKKQPQQKTDICFFMSNLWPPLGPHSMGNSFRSPLPSADLLQWNNSNTHWVRTDIRCVAQIV